MARSLHPTFPAFTRATPSVITSSTAATARRSTSHFRTSTSKAIYHSKTQAFCTPTAFKIPIATIYTTAHAFTLSIKT